MPDAIVKLKRSSVQGKVPLPQDLEHGEVAINYTDGALYYKAADNTIKNLIVSPESFEDFINSIVDDRVIVMSIALG
jgi:hypothetical protein